jgi:CRISPR-associated protein Cas1
MAGGAAVIKRTIEVSSEPAHLTAKLEQLLVEREGHAVGSIPCEDIGMVVVDQPQTTYSQAALVGLARYDAVLVVCGRDHLPAAVLLPLADHSQVVWRVAEQVAVSKPLKKRLWKQLVRAKVRAQALNLAANSPARRKLLELARLVRSGDPSNVEARAAQVYWRHWLNGDCPDFPGVPDENSPTTSAAAKMGLSPSGDGKPFRRDADGDGLNALLNYGYAILRAAVARAVVAAGLLPALGLFHANRSNAFCLADDLMEPLRPLVDRRVRRLYREQQGDCPDFRGAVRADAHCPPIRRENGTVPFVPTLNPEVKAGLLGLLADPVRLNRQRGPLMVSLHRMVASLVRCYEGEADRLEIPQACLSADTDVCGW